jgi:filamentous hemagglutinin family protein
MSRFSTLPVFALTLAASFLVANPTDPNVVSGEALFRPEGAVLQIETSRDATIDWCDFSIDLGEKTVFVQPSIDSLVLNRVIGANSSAILGTLEANGKVVLLNPNGLLVGKEGMIDTASFIASTQDSLLPSSIANYGKIRAGEIFLLNQNGLVEHFGAIESPGGEVRLLGKENQVYGTIDVSAPTGGGRAFIGGGYQGSDPELCNSKKTFVSDMAIVSANATDNGNGGMIILWGDEATANGGTLLARGGDAGGNGGLIEISSKGSLFAAGFTDTRAPLGKTGNLLLDPCAVTITTMDMGIMTFPPPGYVFSGSTAMIDANVGAMNLQTYLAATDVTIDASASGTGAPGTGSITVTTGFTWSSGNKLTMIADGFITVLGSITSSATGLASTHVVVDLQAPTITVGDLGVTSSFVGGLGAGTTTGRVLIDAPSSLNVYGGAGIGSAIGADAIVFSVGDLNLISGPANDSGSILAFETLFQGVVNGNAQFISDGGGSGVTSNSMVPQIATIDLMVGGNLTMTGGTGSGMIGSASTLLIWGGGSITCTVGGDLRMTGGGSPVDGNAAIFGQGGTTQIQVTAGNIYLTGGTSAVMMGGSGNFAGIATFVGEATVTATGTEIVLQGGATTDCNVFIQGGDGLTLTAPSLRAFGGAMPGADVVIGGIFHSNFTVTGDVVLNGFGAQAFVIGAATDLIVQIGGDCTIIGSTTTPMMGISFTGFDCFGPAPGFAGNLIMTARNLFITGGSGDSCYAGLGVGYNTFSGMFDTGGFIDLSITGSTGITLTGGSGMSSPAFIEIFGSDPTNSIAFTSPHPSSNLLMTGSTSEARIATFSGPIIDPIGGSIILTGAASIVVGPGPVSELRLIAGRNIELQSPLSTIQNLSAGDLTLVVDNQFPSPPLLGNGRFLSVAGSTVFSNDGMADGPLRIFSSGQSLNSIQGTLNSLAFIPGTLFIDTAQEQWATYYPSAFGGIPFTIFYKEAESILANQALIIADQLLVGLHPFNEFPGWKAAFDFSGDPYYLRRRYLNLINHPKTYTLLTE